MDYATVRFIHITCAIVSVSLFAARGALQWRGVDWRRWRWLRVVPHLNDTLLLSAAVALALMSHQYPLAQAWLSAKVVALLLYIAIGSVALSPRVSQGSRRVAYLLALGCVSFILLVARSRSPVLGLPS